MRTNDSPRKSLCVGPIIRHPCFLRPCRRLCTTCSFTEDRIPSLESLTRLLCSIMLVTFSWDKILSLCFHCRLPPTTFLNDRFAPTSSRCIVDSRIKMDDHSIVSNGRYWATVDHLSYLSRPSRMLYLELLLLFPGRIPFVSKETALASSFSSRRR